VTIVTGSLGTHFWVMRLTVYSHAGIITNSASIQISLPGVGPILQSFVKSSLAAHARTRKKCTLPKSVFRTIDCFFNFTVRKLV
jgi:hypothetical protein